MSLHDAQKILPRYRHILSALSLLAVVAGIFWAVNAPALVGVAASKRQLPVYCVQRDDKQVAISFDAAWGITSSPGGHRRSRPGGL